MFNKVILIAILLIVGSQAQRLDAVVEAKFAELLKKYDNETPAVQDTRANVNAFAKGFVEGIASAKVFDEIKACIKDSEEVQADINRAIELIKTKNPEKVKEGIQLLGKAAEIIPVAAHDCQAAHADIQKLIKLIHTFTNPKSFLYYVGKSLIINHVEVLAEFNHIVEAYYDQDFEKLGYWVGRTMDTIVLGDKNKLRQEMADFINEQNVGWTAEIPKQFEDETLEDFESRLMPLSVMDNSHIKDLTVMDYEGIQGDIPTHFDSREQWGNCVHGIRNQGKCGSCWAFAASESLSDRFCIASNKKVNNVLSPQYMVSCNNILNHGCNGGNPFLSWKFLERYGIVTDQCLPYQSGEGKNPVKCRSLKKCNDGSPLVNYFAKKGSTVILPNPVSIQTNLLKYGPLEAGFMVYEDFKLYKGGIYKHTTGKLLGGHAVKLIGWGEEAGEKYWIAANSWTEKWGENGFFKIAFGECGIDGQVVVGEADLDRVKQTEARFFF